MNAEMKSEVKVFWFRRDLRLEDNVALSKALKGEQAVLPIFIFDQDIVDELPKDDARITFIYQCLKKLNQSLGNKGTSLSVYKGRPLEVLSQICLEFKVHSVYANRDYEPYAVDRDNGIKDFLQAQGIGFLTFKDQVIFEMDEVTKNDGKPYTIYTPFKNKWLAHFKEEMILERTTDQSNYVPSSSAFPSMEELGFSPSTITVRDFDLGSLDHYSQNRDIPAKDATSYLGPHLRFGTLSIRTIIRRLNGEHPVFLSELIWREFFMQILHHFPKVVHENFHRKYDGISWRNDEAEFASWCQGDTGYPMVDAGMRQLNQTGYMHNRVRMVTASFLCKHLLIDWRWGEAYFAGRLLDYELSSNNGNWQWAAGTGCDAAPYFRVFNPTSQLERFDKKMEYVKRWVPELLTQNYRKPMVDHKMARDRALKVYKEGISKMQA